MPRSVQNGRARRERMEHEEVEFLAQAAVVALPRLLQPVEMGLELVLLEERGAVDALQHLPARIAPPVRAGGVEQLEVLEPPGAGHVRTAAQVGERPVGVGRDDLVVAQLADPLELERVVGELLVGGGAVHLVPDKRIVGLRHLGHPRLDLLEVLGREGTRHLEVVVEALVDRRAEPDAGRREDLAHRRGHDVRRGVAQHVERLAIPLGEDRDRRIAADREHEVAHGAVDPDRHRRLGEPRPDRLGDLAPGDPGGILPHAAVGQGQADLGGRGGGGHCRASDCTGCTTGSVRGASQKYRTIPSRITPRSTIQRLSSAV